MGVENSVCKRFFKPSAVWWKVFFFKKTIAFPNLLMYRERLFPPSLQLHVLVLK